MLASSEIEESQLSPMGMRGQQRGVSRPTHTRNSR
jgi:hypothetical protein